MHVRHRATVLAVVSAVFVAVVSIGQPPVLTDLWGVSAATPAAAAQSTATRTAPDEYTATTANLTPGSGEELSFQITSWSTDEDLGRVTSVLMGEASEKGRKGRQAEPSEGDSEAETQSARPAMVSQGAPNEPLPGLDNLPKAGFIWTSGPLGYALIYARRFPLPDGGERVLFVTARPIGTWDRQAWKPDAAPAMDRPYTVIELRLNSQGVGEGKMSLAAPVTVNEQTLELENSEGAPVLLKDVKRQPKPYWARQN